ncbi:hypothetical protein HS041_30470 [Planomonospora sp. ID67723]|uniref:hypothetical protein n=1 Tax=Planomonospora sp. ID67723 TaxID=2738134 RepID=UPI0018C3B5FE|nr:hypothetical protein [Planomonospora sp. ID67723]MBG0832032.1 hypothetical protein [Planomonospora sp. ID67723]
MNSSPSSGAAPSPMRPEVKALKAFALVSRDPVPTTAGVCAWAAGEPAPPPSLLRFTQTRGFRQESGRLAASLGEDPHRVRARLVDALAAVARSLGRDDLAERDWQRLMDAMVLVLAHPPG